MHSLHASPCTPTLVVWMFGMLRGEPGPSPPTYIPDTQPTKLHGREVAGVAGLAAAVEHHAGLGVAFAGCRPLLAVAVLVHTCWGKKGGAGVRLYRCTDSRSLLKPQPAHTIQTAGWAHGAALAAVRQHELGVLLALASSSPARTLLAGIHAIFSKESCCEIRIPRIPRPPPLHQPEVIWKGQRPQVLRQFAHIQVSLDLQAPKRAISAHL